ncbi:MAG: NADH-quinone oxidoreductase subunit I [Deltaproteobacteria bacterium]
MSKPAVEKRYTLSERVYLVEILKGLVLTWRHFMFNFRASFRPGPHTVPTCWQYPEDRREISPVFRGEHMLCLDEQGRELCVGCGMCAKTCPAQCITVKMAKVAEGEEGRYAGKTYSQGFNIDLLRCIFCGFCEEACPKGAIVLGQGYELARYTPGECQLGKERLLANFRKAKEEGKLKPKKRPVPVAGEAAKEAGAEEKGAKAKGTGPAPAKKSSPPKS